MANLTREREKTAEVSRKRLLTHQLNIPYKKAMHSFIFSLPLILCSCHDAVSDVPAGIPE
jgi:hypothetical protein